MEDKIQAEDLVYVSTENLNLPKGRARKLLLKFIGPYKVLKAEPQMSTYMLELPAELVACHIHPKFHALKLRVHHLNNDMIFPGREINTFYDFGQPDDQEWQVTKLVGHKWEGN